MTSAFREFIEELKAGLPEAVSGADMTADSGSAVN
jgi:hypothetical protein